MYMVGFVLLATLWLVSFLATVPGHALEQCDLADVIEPIAKPKAGQSLLQRTFKADTVVVPHVVKAPLSLASRASLRNQDSSSGQVTVQPFVCSRSKAMQSTTDDKGVTKIQELRVETGTYEDILTIPNGWTDPPFSHINSCAISPKDAIIHCSMEIESKGSFLVRVDMTKVAFVAKLPGWRFAATFDGAGNYWIYGESGLSVVKDVASKPSYSSLYDLSGNAPGVEPMTLGADFATMQGDLDKSGVEGTYLLSVSKNDLYVVKVAIGTDILGPPYQHWVIKNAAGLPPSAYVWGTAWNYNNSIFFSADTGEGVYRLDDSLFSIHNASFIRMGPAQETHWNDGLSCVGQGTPWEPDIQSGNCDGGKALQATTTHLSSPTNPASKSYFQYLDKATGTYQPYYEVKKNWTDPPFNSINSCAINPLDNIIYCTMEIDNRGSFLVRIDSTKVGFVAKVPGWMYAGVFDVDGTYYMYGNVGLSFITGVAGRHAYSSYYHLGGGQVYNGPHTIETMGADLAMLQADLEGNGIKQYLLSVQGNMLCVVLASGSFPPKAWKLVGEGLPPREVAETWGSSWNFRNKIYFAPDSGAGVYELLINTIDLANGTAKFSRAGESQATTWNDGFSCVDDISPFTIEK